MQMAHRMGITSYIDPVPAIFLGSSEVSVKEMVGAFSIYANKGVYNAPMMVTKIEDKYGNVLANFYPESREVITENTAFLMANLLQGVVDEGTGRRLRFRYGFKNQIGGKTGTTQNHSDGWFIGITPDLAGGVWVLSISRIWRMGREPAWHSRFGLCLCRKYMRINLLLCRKVISKNRME